MRFWDSLGTRALERARASDPLSWKVGGEALGFSPSCVVVVVVAAFPHDIAMGPCVVFAAYFF